MRTALAQPTASHPKGTRARVLLTSVFGPYAQDDEFGSRAINPMELYHNQVTRAQGPFSLRMHHRSWGLMLIQQNISAPSTLLDFPTRKRFVRELERGDYDIVGISAIIVNAGKVREMCRLVRRHSPRSTIVVGGHVSAIPGIERLIDADIVVKGEGVSWFRRYLGEDETAPVRHPAILSSFGFRLFGVRGPRGGDPAATVIPSVGCPMGCNFCTTSAFFGGKGSFVNFYESGEALFRVMCEIEARLGVSCFFVMDENFLLYKKRALGLLDHMKAHGKAWSLYVFSSANAIAKYDMRQLVELGISWVWIGLESKQNAYAKLQNTDTQSLVRELRSHGIRVQGSTIIGMEHHTPGNLDDEIEHAVAHEADFHQFMLYTPIPGTPLHARMAAEGRLLDDVELADIHGQFKFNFVHEAISRDDSKVFLDRAFARDYERNGPSLLRLAETMYAGWRRYRDDGDVRVRARVGREARELRRAYAAVTYAIERYLCETGHPVAARAAAFRKELERDAGVIGRAFTRSFGSALHWAARRDARRFPSGRALEPRTWIERRNWSAAG